MDIAEIYRENRAFVFRFVMRKCDYNQHEAEDIVQDTFEVAIKKLSQFTHGKVRTWLCGIALWSIRQRRRNHALRADRMERSGMLDEPEAMATDVAQNAENAQLLARCRRVVATMPAPFVECFEMALVDGLPYAEIAAAQGCSEGTVAARVCRVRKAIIEGIDKPLVDQVAQDEAGGVTREGIMVRPGQLWREIDKRYRRECLITRVAGGRAYFMRGAREGSVSIASMHRHSRGYELITDVQPAAA